MESKHQNQISNPWNGRIQHHPRKWNSSKQLQPKKSYLLFIFGGRRGGGGLLIVDFLNCDDTLNSMIYCESLKNLHHACNPNKNCVMRSKGIVFLHDNARPHTANQTQELIWEQLDHPPYSPDLAPSNYHMFLHLKRCSNDCVAVFV